MPSLYLSSSGALSSSASVIIMKLLMKCWSITKIHSQWQNGRLELPSSKKKLELGFECKSLLESVRSSDGNPQCLSGCELRSMQHFPISPPVSDSHTETQPQYCTILTIDFIIIFSSPPASPPLIFTTGTSIALMACKNQPPWSECQTLTFE